MREVNLTKFHPQIVNLTKCDSQKSTWREGREGGRGGRQGRREGGREGVGGREERRNVQSPMREGGGSLDNAPYYISMYALSIVAVYTWCAAMPVSIACVYACNA